METALLNTLLGMGTVFIVLIFISFVISLFGLINKAATKPKQVNTPAVQTKAAPAAPVQVAATDDSELIAVIAAAIAANMTETTGQYVSADGLVIRSIKKRR